MEKISNVLELIWQIMLRIGLIGILALGIEVSVTTIKGSKFLMIATIFYIARFILRYLDTRNKSK